MTDPHRWPRVKDVFHAALALPLQARGTFVREACRGDAAIRQEVESLLAAHADADGFAETPAIAALADDRTFAGPVAPALAPGVALGPYRIVGPIDTGAMGEVYRARDTRLARDVAVKVLPATRALDTERIARLEQEARVLACLSHPHIATIYSLEVTDGICALVMELIDGQTLADHLARGPLTTKRALEIAGQIAGALEAAHDRGIVHRDLKPANVKLTGAGDVKVLDFGLATAVGPEEDHDRDGDAAGVLMREGVIAGTPAYMSPEQARGERVDQRADIWAFGCVLYEMLTGRRTFAGATTSDTLNGTLEHEPDWEQVPSTVPAGVRRLLRRCLERDPKRRLHHAADARIEVEDAVRGDPDGPPAPRRANRRGSLVVPLTVFTAGVLVTWVVTRVAWPAVPTPTLRPDITTPSTVDPVSIALAPDGRSIVFVAGDEGQSRLWRRRFDEAEARPLAGTDDASLPFWSPDGRFVGFFADGRIKRLDLETGLVDGLSRAAVPAGAAWNRDGVILHPTAPNSPLYRTSLKGGLLVLASELSAGQTGHRAPVFLPDGRHFLFYAIGNPDVRGIYVGELGMMTSRRLLDADTPAVYAPQGYLLYVQHGTLFSHRFDVASLTLQGDPQPLASGVIAQRAAGIPAVSVSAAGPIAYRTGSAGGRRQFVWLDRTGRVLSRVGEPASFGPSYASMSPDGTRIAVQRSVDGNTDIYVVELRRGTPIKITSDPEPDIAPIWSPDGTRLVYASRQDPSFDLFETAAVGRSSRQLLLHTDLAKQPTDWSRDGRYLLMRTVHVPQDGDMDIWGMALDDRTPFPLVRTPAEERDAQFSPDGRWIAYQSNEIGGRPEIYAQPFSGAGDRVRISTNGGVQARWRADGRELFYLRLDGQLMAVQVALSADGRTLQAGTAAALFHAPVGALQGVSLFSYSVASDGQQFLVDEALEEPAAPISLIFNWTGEPPSSPSGRLR